MIAKKLLTTIAFAFVLLFSGCAEDDFNEVDGLCPLVVSTVPEDGDIDVPLNQVITATFNEKMNPSTITGASFIVSLNGVPIAGAVSYNGLTATFIPASLLEENTEYTGTITTMAKDERGNALQENYVWSFTTVQEFLVVVSSNPLIGGITTGGGLFLKGTPVTVTAAPNAGYTFTNWTDNGTQVSTSPNYQFVIVGDRTLVANYTLIPPTQFAVNTSSLPIAGGSTTGSGSYDAGTNVTVTATANTGYNFVNWTLAGVEVSTNPNYTFVLNASKNLVANFVLKTYTLQVIAVNGTVLKVPQQVTYNHGASVVLTPTANSGYEFTSWTGDATGNNNPLTVIMTGNKIITANFSPLAFTLNVTAVNGTVVKNPNTPTYTNGTNVELTATPNSGYEFTSWSGDATGSNNPLTVLMNANKNITANFTAIVQPPVNAGLCPNPAIDLGSARNFAILAETAITTTGVTSITGNVGISPNAAIGMEGFNLIMDSSGTFSTSNYVTGKIYAADYTPPTPIDLGLTIGDMKIAYTAGMALAPTTVTEYHSGNLNNETLVAGVYKFGTDLNLTNTITLDGGGTDCAVFVFQIAGSLIVNPGTKIILTGGAKADNIYWVVAGAGATLNTDVAFSGTILSQTLISLAQRTTVNGRLFAQTAVTLIGNTVVMPSN